MAITFSGVRREPPLSIYRACGRPRGLHWKLLYTPDCLRGPYLAEAASGWTLYGTSLVIWLGYFLKKKKEEKKGDRRTRGQNSNVYSCLVFSCRVGFHWDDATPLCVNNLQGAVCYITSLGTQRRHYNNHTVINTWTKSPSKLVPCVCLNRCDLFQVLLQLYPLAVTV